MAQTGAQQTKNVCSQCGRTFDSRQELREHEKNCKGPGASAVDPTKAVAGSKNRSKEEIESDMEIEEAFDATDN